MRVYWSRLPRLGSKPSSTKVLRPPIVLQLLSYLQFAQKLLGKGAELNAAATNVTGYTALTGAVASGHASVAKWLAEKGADVNYRYAKGYSPLLTAAANGRLEIVKMSLARGADLHARTDDGKNALAFAQERGHNEVAKYLLELGLTP